MDECTCKFVSVYICIIFFKRKIRREFPGYPSWSSEPQAWQFLPSFRSLNVGEGQVLVGPYAQDLFRPLGRDSERNNNWLKTWYNACATSICFWAVTPGLILYNQSEPVIVTWWVRQRKVVRVSTSQIYGGLSILPSTSYFEDLRRQIN